VFHHTPRKTSQRDAEAPETLESLGSFKVSASASEAATSRLGLVSDKILNVSVSSRSRRHGSRVSSRSRLRRSRAHLCCPQKWLWLSASNRLFNLEQGLIILFIFLKKKLYLIFWVKLICCCFCFISQQIKAFEEVYFQFDKWWSDATAAELFRCWFNRTWTNVSHCDCFFLWYQFLILLTAMQVWCL